MSTVTPNVAAALEALRSSVEDAGLPTGLGVKPETATGQPWAIVTLLSDVFDGGILAFNEEHDAVVLVRAVGATVQQAHAAYWRADGAVMAVDAFDGGVVTFATRDTLTGPTRDDATFPGRSVYYVDATYRLWLATATT